MFQWGKRAAQPFAEIAQQQFRNNQIRTLSTLTQHGQQSRNYSSQSQQQQFNNNTGGGRKGYSQQSQQRFYNNGARNSTWQEIALGIGVGAALTAGAEYALSQSKKAQHTTPNPKDFMRDVQKIKGVTVVTDKEQKAVYDKAYTVPTPTSSSLAAVEANSVEAIQQVIKLCNKYNIGIVPQGGNTGLVQGSNAHKNEIVLLPKLEKLEIDKKTNTVRAGATVTPLEIQNEADDLELNFAFEFTPMGTATVGAMVANGSGGTRDSVEDFVTYVKMVDGLGNIHEFRYNPEEHKRAFKDSVLPSPDLPPLTSQGYLGVVVEVGFKLKPKNKYVETALIGVDNLDALYDIQTTLENSLGDKLIYTEIMYDSTVSKLTESSSVENPLQRKHPYYIAVQAGSPNDKTVKASFNQTLRTLAAKNLTKEHYIAKDADEAENIIELRDGLSTAVRDSINRSKGEKPLSHDISVPKETFGTFLKHATHIVQHYWPNDEVLAFGHMRFGGIHFNLVERSTPQGAKPTLDSDEKELFAHYKRYKQGAASEQHPGNVKDFVYWLSYHYKGTHSAEHGGLGDATLKYTVEHAPAQELFNFQALKEKYDPNNVMQRVRTNELNAELAKHKSKQFAIQRMWKDTEKNVGYGR